MFVADDFEQYRAGFSNARRPGTMQAAQATKGGKVQPFDPGPVIEQFEEFVSSIEEVRRSVWVNV
jgi:hypothetical protein